MNSPGHEQPNEHGDDFMDLALAGNRGHHQKHAGGGADGRVDQVVEMIDPGDLVRNEIDRHQQEQDRDARGRRNDVVGLREIDLIGEAVRQRQTQNGQERIETSRCRQQHSGQGVGHRFTLR